MTSPEMNFSKHSYRFFWFLMGRLILKKVSSLFLTCLQSGQVSWVTVFPPNTEFKRFLKGVGLMAVSNLSKIMFKNSCESYWTVTSTGAPVKSFRAKQKSVGL
jgi:hypothetical protein